MKILLFLIFVSPSFSHARFFDSETGASDEAADLSTTEKDAWWGHYLKNEGSRFFMYGKSCETLEEDFIDLGFWSQSSGNEEAKKCEMTTVCKTPLDCGTQGNEYLRRMEVTEVLPEVVRKKHLTSLKTNANCWGSVLSYLGINSEDRFVSPREFYARMNSSACQPVRTESEIGPSTVVAIRDKREARFQDGGTEELHGFIWATPTLGFSKNGPGEKYPFELQPLERIWATFSVPKECQTFNHSPDCIVYADYFNCGLL